MESIHLQSLVFLLFWFLCMRSTTGGNTTVSNAREFKNGCPRGEREALVHFKHHIVDTGNLLSSWESKQKDCCQWSRIICNKTSGHVYGLDLSPPSPDGFFLEGEISSSLLELQYLTHLDLSYFVARGHTNLKLIGSLKNLKYLNLSGIIVDDEEPLDDLRNLTRLVTLDLSETSFPNVRSYMFLTHLSDLKHLDMHSNDLSQATDLLQAISMMPSLTYLYLPGCSLSPIIPPPPPRANSSKFLQVVDFSSSNLTSSIFPWFFNFNNSLVALYLQENQFQGRIPDAFGAMISLKHLDLSVNYLEGDIPRSLSNVSSLETLDLSWNCLSGEVPHLHNLSCIKELHLQMNKLNGTSLTPSIGLLSNLEVLDLSSNSISAVISDIHFLSLSKVRSLDVSCNSFALKARTNWNPPFQLQILKLRSCKLGPDFPQWIQTQRGLIHLDISDAGISDVISNWFWELPPTLTYLNLSHNSISGEVGKLPSILDNFWSTIDLSSNHFHGPIPRLLQNTTVLNLSGNRLSGNISNLCSSSDQYVSYLDLSDNILSGEIPDCWMHMVSLWVLNLANNKFSGSIPASIGQDTLKWLNLRNNSLSGELPSSLANCPSLALLNVGHNRLSGRVPVWGDRIPVWRNVNILTVLILRSNGFHGTIPKQLCNLTSLQILDLSHNNISGTIPRCLSRMTAMTKKDRSVIRNLVFYLQGPPAEGFSIDRLVPYVDNVTIVLKGLELEYGRTLDLVKCIDLSRNNLSGKIPAAMASLVDLISLNLSHNQLSGVIPQEIGRLELLESLDLSENHLSGRLPESLTRLHFLSYLNVSQNELSGKIPTGTQIQSFNNTSFEGNARLCGEPLTKRCPGEEEAGAYNHSTAGGRENVDNQDYISPGFHLSMGVGFAAAFWAVCGSLLLYRP